ncbi:hypothetical protein CRE_22077 [Caenorhabditis remanei]|uniref:Integrase catalytic domain-containing protein n=1 Tax=Caenorhabditis remanei TaxID=31234 RepID=E3N8V9_CAERE|nr:hypothetical protein CRE_22077 [Caenorhabditis remanei]
MNAVRQLTSQIEDGGTEVKFGHVTTDQNPADLGTRGLEKSNFSTSIWWNGPKVLEEKEWTNKFKFFSLKSRDDFNTFAVVKREEDATQVFNCAATKSFEVMKRIAAQAMKFIKITSERLPEERKKKMSEKIPFLQLENSPGRISSAQIKEAEVVLIKDHQRSFTQKFLNRCKDLGLVEDPRGVIVCKGRMELAELNKDSREPILIHEESDLAAQIIRNAHGKFHVALDHTMDKVRRRFWMLKLRQKAKTILSRCSECQRFNKQPCRYPDMARMPKSRLKPTKPFECTGLDNFGPITIKKEDGTEDSVYGTIFTCAVTRLVHVEVVSNMSTQQFIQAFRRFVAIRGMPKKIVSDNGTNFVLGKKIIEEAMTNDPLCQSIEWKMITPYSPWKGGFYERMVKSVKHAFMKNQRRNKLSLEEIQTVFYEVTATINSRPLTYLEEDVNNQSPIRPIDFVYSEMDTTLPLQQVMESTEDYLPPAEMRSKETKLGTIEALKSSIKRTDAIWNTFNTTYLSELREHHRSRMNNKRGSPKLPKEGQVVLLCDENQPRNEWKRGRVVKINKSDDGSVRDIEYRQNPAPSRSPPPLHRRRAAPSRSPSPQHLRRNPARASSRSRGRGGGGSWGPGRGRGRS